MTDHFGLFMEKQENRRIITIFPTLPPFQEKREKTSTNIIEYATMTVSAPSVNQGPVVQN